MTSARAYLDAILPRIERLGTEALPAIERAGELIADAIAGGGRVWVPATSHSLHGEATNRAGGLMAVHILHDPIAIQPGDAVLIGTNAGTVRFTVDTALAAKARGAIVIALTQLDFERDSNLILEHPSGHRLHELAEVVIDLGGEVGDGELALIDGVPPVLPSSGATGVVALWMIFAAAIERMVARGTPPLVWQAMQLPGAMERNARALEQYRRTGIGVDGGPTG